MIEVRQMPGHLVRRFQQIAVAIFHNEVDATGYDLTPVQYAALATICENKGIDQATLAGMIAYDRATITGVVDRLLHKGLISREISKRDRRARELAVTDRGLKTIETVTPAVEAAQRVMLRGLTPQEAEEFMRLLAKATEAANDLSRAPMISENATHN
ncbi:MAG: MarR family transcriptional regulator [Alphaproteobacteria bacterium]